ncbi:hypothetical protein HYS99_01775 [Candidatus Giovannonibacteria bacterium]|nr:hypothetical protein [Candidatus Giovannonibacteria bacterium]
MNLILLAAIAALLSVPKIAYEHQAPAQIVQIETKENAEIKKANEILDRIAICESHGRQFDESGKVLIGGVNKHDVGKFQINALYWKGLAEELGHDIYTETGNYAMALELYKRYGTSPWIWSKKCWSK